jgi:hypothetical protein
MAEAGDTDPTSLALRLNLTIPSAEIAFRQAARRGKLTAVSFGGCGRIRGAMIAQITNAAKAANPITSNHTYFG